MQNEQKPAIRVSLARVDEELAQALGRELEGKQTDGSRSATDCNDAYRASGTKPAPTTTR